MAKRCLNTGYCVQTAFLKLEKNEEKISKKCENKRKKGVYFKNHRKSDLNHLQIVLNPSIIVKVGSRERAMNLEK